MAIFEIESNGEVYEIDAPDEQTALGAFNPQLAAQYQRRTRGPSNEQRLARAAALEQEARDIQNAPMEKPFGLSDVVDTVLEGIGHAGAGIVGGAAGLVEGGARNLTQPGATFADSMKTIADPIRRNQEALGGLVPETRGGRSVKRAAGRAFEAAPESVQAGLSKVGEAAGSDVGTVGLALADAVGLGAGGKLAKTAGAARTARETADKAAAARAGTAIGVSVGDPVARARARGFLLRPSDVEARRIDAAPAGTKPPSTPGTFMQGFAGDTNLATQLALENGKRVGKLAAEEAGLPPGATLSRHNVANEIKRHGEVYERVTQEIPVVLIDDTIGDTVKALDAARRENPLMMNSPGVERMREQLLALVTGEKLTARQVVDAIKGWRKDATTLFNKTNRSPDDLATAQAYRDLAVDFEALLERNAVASGSPRLVSDLQAARQQLAKLHDIDSAMKGDRLDPAELSKLDRSGKSPLSGGLQDLADLAREFPDVIRYTGGLTIPSQPFTSMVASPGYFVRRGAGSRGVPRRIMSEKFQNQYGVEDPSIFRRPAPIAGRGPTQPPPPGGPGGGPVDFEPTPGMPPSGAVAARSADGPGMEIQEPMLPDMEQLPEPPARPGDLTVSDPPQGGSDVMPYTTGARDEFLRDRLDMDLDRLPSDSALEDRYLPDQLDELGAAVDARDEAFRDAVGRSREGSIAPFVGDMDIELAPATRGDIDLSNPAMPIPDVDQGRTVSRVPPDVQVPPGVEPGMTASRVPAKMPTVQPDFLEDLGLSMAVDQNPPFLPIRAQKGRVGQSPTYKQRRREGPATEPAKAEDFPVESDLPDTGPARPDEFPFELADDGAPSSEAFPIEFADTIPAGPNADIAARFPGQFIDPDWKIVESPNGYTGYIIDKNGEVRLQKTFTRDGATRSKGENIQRYLAVIDKEAGKVVNSDSQMNKASVRSLLAAIEERGILAADYDRDAIMKALEAGGGDARNPGGTPWFRNIRRGPNAPNGPR